MKLKYKNKHNEDDLTPMLVFLTELEDKKEDELTDFFTSVIKQNLREELFEIMKRVYGFEIVSKTEKYLDELEEYLESEMN